MPPGRPERPAATGARAVGRHEAARRRASVADLEHRFGPASPVTDARGVANRVGSEEPRAAHRAERGRAVAGETRAATTATSPARTLTSRAATSARRPLAVA